MKEIIRETRLLIVYKLLNIAMSVCPDGKTKYHLAVAYGYFLQKESDDYQKGGGKKSGKFF